MTRAAHLNALREELAIEWVKPDRDPLRIVELTATIKEEQKQEDIRINATCTHLFRDVYVEAVRNN